MPQPIALCIENCYPPHESLRFLRCVAAAGVGSGLSILPGGGLAWRSGEPCLGQLWVSGDDQLMVYRPEASPGWLQVHRGGRSVEVPEGKPVVLLDGDHLVIPGFCFRVHLHGAAPELAEPTYLGESEPARKTQARLAAAGLVAVGSLFVAQAACTTEKPVHEKPAAKNVDEPRPPQPLPPPAETDQKRTTPPVEIRDHPPGVSVDGRYVMTPRDPAGGPARPVR